MTQPIVLLTIAAATLIFLVITIDDFMRSLKNNLVTPEDAVSSKQDFRKALEKELEKEIELARMELQNAQQQFDEAEPEYVEAAAYRWKAAERKYATLVANSKAIYKKAV